jgi:ABC-type glutathione transport system ATPase component
VRPAWARGAVACVDTTVWGVPPPQDEDATTIAAEMQDALGPLLEGVDETDVQVCAIARRAPHVAPSVCPAARLLSSRASCAPTRVPRPQALCTKIANVFKGLGEDGTDASGAADKVVEDHVVKCDNIILAYAGKSLLRSSSLRLVRGRRYGIVGQNGVGKTTLLTRIDAGDIANFPTDIKVVFVRHEILANDDQNVLQVCVAWPAPRAQGVGLGEQLCLRVCMHAHERTA